jgi:hypothetical protein
MTAAKAIAPTSPLDRAHEIAARRDQAVKEIETAAGAPGDTEPRCARRGF